MPLHPARRRGTMAAVALLASCARPAPPPHSGPILLITLDAMRADVVGALGGPAGLTPHLDALAAEADWVARAVSPSSWTVPAMASLFTGLQPFRHQSWTPTAARLRDDLETLPEALKAAGYATHGFSNNPFLNAGHGYNQGFDTLGILHDGARAAAVLGALPPGKTFVWAHILAPHAPYIRRSAYDAHVPATLRHAALPDRLDTLDLQPYFDPSTVLPEPLRRDAWALYLYNVADSDRQAGDLLAALRRSGQWDRSLVVITADHGEDFGGTGQVLHGGNLGRPQIEVPLLVKWPRRAARRLAVAPGQRIATHRLWATLSTAVGRPAPDPAHAPNLTDESAADWPVLSELYFRNGTNVFSLVAGERQLVWTSRFAPPEPEFYGAVLEWLGGRPSPGLREPGPAILARHYAQFARLPAFAGGPGTKPALEVFTWKAGDATAVERLEDEAAREELARALRAAWRERNGEDAPPHRRGRPLPDLSPEDEKKLRALGYIVGTN